MEPLRVALIGYRLMHNLEHLQYFLEKRVQKLFVVGLPTVNSKNAKIQVSSYTEGALTSLYYLPCMRTNNSYSLLLAFIIYTFQILLSALLLAKNKVRYDLVICVAFQSAIVGVILKKLGLTKHLIYYSLDFFVAETSDSLSRRITSRFFITIDRLCANHADVIWNLSEKMKKLRSSYSQDLGSPQITVPHPVIPFRRCNRSTFRDKNRFLFCGWVKRGVGLELLVEVLPELIQSYPDIVILVVGSGPFLPDLKKAVRDKGLGTHICFLGFIPEIEHVARIAGSCIAGLALYPDSKSHYIRFTDSNKTKRYIEFGLPVLTTHSNPLSKEIIECNAGMVVNYDAHEVKAAILNLIITRDAYSRFLDGVIRFSQKYGIEQTYGKAFELTLKYLANKQLSRSALTLSNKNFRNKLI